MQEIWPIWPWDAGTTSSTSIMGHLPAKTPSAQVEQKVHSVSKCVRLRTQEKILVAALTQLGRSETFRVSTGMLLMKTDDQSKRQNRGGSNTGLVGMVSVGIRPTTYFSHTLRCRI